MPVPYRDGTGTWHITTKGTGYADSMFRLREILTEHAPFTIHGDGFKGIPRSDLNSGQGWGFGKLPGEYHLALEFATYVVFSWATPIAWFIPQRLDGGPGNEPEWHVPEVDYGATTGRYQAMIRAVLRDMEGFVIIP